jgi:hypothetical protein
MIQQKVKTHDVVHCRTVIPAEISQNAENNTYKMAEKIVKAFNLKNTPMHFQAFVDGDSINVIEIAARVGGVTSCKVIEMVSGFDIIDYSIDSLIGNAGDMHYHTPRRCFTILMIYASQSVFGKVTGPAELVQQGVIDDFFILKTEGAIIAPDSKITARNKVMALILSAKSPEQLSEKVEKTYHGIDVLDTEGRSVIIRNLMC